VSSFATDRPTDADGSLSLALQARAEAKAQCRNALRFVRRHRAQARLDLAELMLSEAARHRARFRFWHHRFVADQERVEP